LQIHCNIATTLQYNLTEDGHFYDAITLQQYCKYIAQSICNIAMRYICNHFTIFLCCMGKITNILHSLFFFPSSLFLLAFTERGDRVSGWRKMLWCLSPISYHWLNSYWLQPTLGQGYVYLMIIDNRTNEVKKSEPKIESKPEKHFRSGYYFGLLAYAIFRFGYRFRFDKNNGPVIGFGFGPSPWIKKFVNVWKLHCSSIFFFNFGIVKAFHLV